MADKRYIQWFNEMAPYGQNGLVYLQQKYGNDPYWDTFLESFQRNNPKSFDLYYSRMLMEQLGRGDIGYNDVYSGFGKYNVSPSEEYTKYLDNAISQENTQADRDFQTEMRDTSLLSSGSQLQQLGLSPSNVISVGGANSGVTSSAANTSFAQSGIGRKQQLVMNQYNQRMAMAKSLIGMAGSMASSGIYGAAFGAAKHSASALAAAASHSGIQALKTGATSGEKYSTDENGFLQF